MLELGHITGEEHQNIIHILEQKKLKAILVGIEFSKQSSNFATYLTTKALVENEDLSQIKDYFILLKGSRGIKLETLIDCL